MAAPAVLQSATSWSLELPAGSPASTWDTPCTVSWSAKAVPDAVGAADVVVGFPGLADAVGDEEVGSGVCKRAVTAPAWVPRRYAAPPSRMRRTSQRRGRMLRRFRVGCGMATGARVAGGVW